MSARDVTQIARVIEAGEALEIPGGDGFAGVVATRPITPSAVQVPNELTVLREAVEQNERGLKLQAKFFDKLRIAQHSIGKLAATGRHDKGYAYIKDEDVVEAANEAAANAGLAIMLKPVKHLSEKLPGSTNKGAEITQGQVTIQLALGDCETGFERVMGEFIGVDVDYGGAAYFKKALTAAKKQALQAVFNIAVSDSADADDGKRRAGKTPALSEEPGTITPAQIEACRKAFSKASKEFGRQAADEALKSVLSTYGVEKIEGLSELRAPAVPNVIVSSAQRLHGEAKVVGATT